MKKPVLVSGTDGVGTKLKLAILMDKHDTVGIDCVAMCVNDVICCGRKAVAVPGLHCVRQERAGEDRADRGGRGRGLRTGGLARWWAARRRSMPGMMPEDDYDLAGFSVGVVDKDAIIEPRGNAGGGRTAGAAVYGCAFQRLLAGAQGVPHWRGRREPSPMRSWEQPLWETLLTPTRIYVKPVLALLSQVRPRAISHITGGGFYENIPRSAEKGHDGSNREGGGDRYCRSLI